MIAVSRPVGERVYGGVLYSGLLDTITAEENAERIRRLKQSVGSLAFYTPIFKRFSDSEGAPLVLIEKAWLSLDAKVLQAGKVTIDSLVEFEGASNDIASLVNLADAIDNVTLRTSSDRCVQLYRPGALMFPHTDEESSVRLVNLAGEADVQWHDPKTEYVIDRTRLTPGDVLHLEGTYLHSVRNAGKSDRIMMGLIDD